MDLAQSTPPGIYRASPPPYVPKESQPPYCTIPLHQHTYNCAQYCHLNHKWQPTMDMMFKSLHSITAALSNTIDFQASLTTPIAAASFDSATTPVATTTPPSTTPPTTTGATTTLAIIHTPFSDTSTIASDPSPVTLLSETQSHINTVFFPNGPVRSLQEAVEISPLELDRPSPANFMLVIYDLIGDISNAAFAQVAWLSKFIERNLGWKTLKYMLYNDFLKALDSSGREREIIKHHHSAQLRNTQAMKKLGDLCQLYPELQEIVSDTSGSENWIWSTAITNWTSRHLDLLMWCFNRVFINILSKLNLKSNSIKGYTSRDFHKDKKLLDYGCPQLKEGIDYEAMGLKWYGRLVLLLTDYPATDDRRNANALRILSPSVPPADHGIPPADNVTCSADRGTPPADHGIPRTNHRIPVPPPSADISKILPPPTPSSKGKEKEKNESNIGGHLMDLAEVGPEDGTSTPADNDTGSMPRVPTETDAWMILPEPAETHAHTTLPAPTRNEAGASPQKPTNLKQKGSPKPDPPATPSSKSMFSDDNNSTEDQEYLRCCLEWLWLDPDCMRMLNDETKMLAQHKRQTEKEAIPIVQQAVNEDHQLLFEAQTQVTAAMYAMCEAILRFNTRLGNILYFARGQGTRMAVMEWSSRWRVCKELEYIC